MKARVEPRPYDQWRSDPSERVEDAADAFGYQLIARCRDEALYEAAAGAPEGVQELAEQTIDIVLGKVAGLLEGLWPMEVGSGHAIELVLGVRVRDKTGAAIETVEISPGKVELPIAYWRWAEDREFRAPAE